MEIRSIILLSSLFVHLNNNCKGQEYDSSYLKLPEYQVNSCLSELFATVAASNKQYYSIDKYFYSLTFKEGKKTRYLSITPARWADTRFLDYIGILKIENVTFLLRGEFQQDSIFKLSKASMIQVKLRKEKGDPDKDTFFNEPSLQGGFYECKGNPIYIEVYTKGKIPNFQMKMRPSK
ncbi:MAG TPA: hypothetical protein VGM63_04700 [Mucilaginibacter sp.]